jgi:two-component system cell cycle sensor histidine kinase PleC
LTKLTPARRDFFWVLVIGILAFVATLQFDLNERLVGWAQVQGDFLSLGIDDLPMGFAVLGLGLGWYAVRRWREYKVESAAHLRTYSHLRLAMDEVVAANQAKSQFLAAMSHELRTPLNAILGFSEIIRGEAIGPTVTARYREYADDIHSSGAHLLAIVNDILDMARSEAGMLRFEVDPFDASEVVSLIGRIVAARARSGGVEIRIDVADGICINGDQDKLRQALLNLAHNAVKFTPAGGTVTLIGRIVAGKARLQVVDTGIGIAAKDIPTALTPFRQIDGALHRKYEGAGLGLPLAKRFIDGQGGTLSIESEVGRGTTVTIILPLAPAVSTAAALPEAA